MQTTLALSRESGEHRIDDGKNALNKHKATINAVSGMLRYRGANREVWCESAQLQRSI